MKSISLLKILFFSILIFIINCDFKLNESDDSTRKPSNKLKVFILAGQSNMEGKGIVDASQKYLDKNGGKGTLKYVYDHDKTKYKYLVDSSGKWAARANVWLVDVAKQGPLSASFNRMIGPELQFGHVVGNYYKSNQVLLIKTAWGGISLFEGFRPPSSGGKVGPKYTEMIKRVKEVLGNIKKYYPGYKGQGYEIAGFGWHQGWNDRMQEPAVNEYLFNCVNLINDLRKDLNLSAMPFVIANTGQGGKTLEGKALKLALDQLAVPKDSRLKVKSNVAALDTRPFQIESKDSPGSQGCHWNQNAGTYMEIGNGMGTLMINMLKGRDVYNEEIEVNNEENSGSCSENIISDLEINIASNKQIAGNCISNFTFTPGGNANHSISLSNLSDDLDLKLYEYDPVNSTKVFLDETSKSGTVDEKIYEVLTSGKTYLVSILNNNSTVANCTLKITYPDNPPPEEIETLYLGENYTKNISVDENGNGGIAYFFTAESESHTISLTSLTLDVDMELFEYDPFDTVANIIYNRIYLANSGNPDSADEEIISDSLTSGAKYILYIHSSWGPANGQFTIRVN